MRKGSRLAVIGIANTMDLPERFLPRIARCAAPVKWMRPPGQIDGTPAPPSQLKGPGQVHGPCAPSQSMRRACACQRNRRVLVACVATPW